MTVNFASGPMKISYFIFISLFLVQTTDAQTVALLDLKQLQTLVNEQNSLVSFWASWCKPCLEEMPYFSKLKKENPDLKITLVNLDTKKDVESKVISIISKKEFSDIHHARISNHSPDDWMPIVDIDWDGAIPATRISYQNEIKFISGKFNNYKDLKKFILSSK